jgi:hypothetical protein
VSDKSKKTEFDELFRDYSSGWSQYIEEARLDLEMHLGAHFTKEQIQDAKDVARTLYPFNKTARQVELLHGYEIRNRHILKIGPVGREDDKAASQHTSLVMQQMMANWGYETLSESFLWGNLVSGSNLFEIYNDRDGNRNFGRTPYHSFLLDPALTKADLSDCRNILTGRWLHEDNIKTLLPTEADRIDRILPTSGSRWVNQPHFARREYMRLYENRWYMQTSFVDYVMNARTGGEIPFNDYADRATGGDRKAARDLVKAMVEADGSPIFIRYQKPVKSVGLDIFVDSELVWSGPNPTGLDEYNVVWMNGEWCPEMEREELKLRSFTRRLRQPQYARDKRLNQLLDILESVVQSGKLVAEGSLANPDDAFKTGQGKALIVKDGWLKKGGRAIQDAVFQFGGPQLGGGILESIEILDREETETTGMNEEIFGSDDKNIPGILHSYRTGAALTGKGGIFQNFRRAKRQVGHKLVKMNQIWLSPEDIMRQINEQPAPGFYEPDFTRFDCNPIEGLLTASQRQLYFLELKELYQLFPNVIPPSFVIANAPVQQPDELSEVIKQREQQSSQVAAAELQTKQMLDQVMLAQAQLDAAKAAGEIADANYDRARTLSEIQKVRDDTTLGFADRMLQYMAIRQQAELRQSAGATK